MKFAVLSDIHGNLPALDAVIEDAGNVDCYIFAGDYCIGNPYPDECITRIRSLDRKYAVRGNEEKYLEDLIGKDPAGWTDGQMQISYWAFQKISPDNLQYVLSLPGAIQLQSGGIPIHVTHTSQAFIGGCEQDEWATAKVAVRYKESWLTQERLQSDILHSLNHSPHFRQTFARLKNGIYIFGHTHIPWSYPSEDGKKLLLNPGSCGEPLDCIKDGIPYTVLDISPSGRITFAQRRALLDKAGYIERLRQSEQFEKAHVWSSLVIKAWETRREQVMPFLQYVEKYAVATGDTQRPFSLPTWEKAFERWQKGLEKPARP